MDDLPETFLKIILPVSGYSAAFKYVPPGPNSSNDLCIPFRLIPLLWYTVIGPRSNAQTVGGERQRQVCI